VKNAITALGTLRTTAAIPRLVSLFESPAADVRRVAAEALGVLGATSSRDALQSLLKDPDVEVRKSASRALERVC
jgi:HEAT repeat protein